MEYRIRLTGEDVLLILRWLETTGQTRLAVSVRDQYYAQQKRALKALDRLSKGDVPETRTDDVSGPKKALYDNFFRGLPR